MALTFGSLFAGIGGFDLGLERAGMRCKWQVEINPYSCAVLEKHWPGIQRHRDVREVVASKGHAVDVVCGGFPCQDISYAGQGAGLDGERSGLWTEYARIIGDIRPSYVIVENVAALLRRGIDRVCGDLAELGYDAEWEVISATFCHLPHSRKRLYLVAYPNGQLREEREGLGTVEDWEETVFGAAPKERPRIWLQAPDSIARMDDGVSRELYEPRATAVGNAVVPAVAEWIGRQVIEHHRRQRRRNAKPGRD